MKLAGSIALTVGLLTTVVTPQAAPASAAAPVDQEPQHKVVLANESVRVIDIRFPPGSASLKHTHAADTVEITIAAGDDGTVGRAVFSKAGDARVVTNTGKTEIRFLDVEILTTGAKAPEALQLPGHTLDFENDKVRIYRVVVGNGQSLVSHSHGHGWLMVPVKGDGAGSYQWHAAGSVAALTNSAITPLEIVELELK